MNEQAPSKELIDRLRNSSSIEHPCSPGLARRAADEIERLQKQVAEREQWAAAWHQALETVATVLEVNACGSPSMLVRDINEAINKLRTAYEPKSDQCEVCRKPLPAVGAWSMPSCPDCQELLEGLGQLMGDFADREQTIKADWIGRAINLICARPSQPPSNGYVDAYYKVAELLGLTTAMPISPMEVFETVMLPRLRELVSRAAQPPGLVCVGQLIQLDDGVGTVFADWNEERFKLQPGAKLYAYSASTKGPEHG